ncbi:hypothetical protein TrRE_jg1225 [Triparma retinervis]|uniref:5'-3' DNA helicase ZGRF1-like N-terminal domain-containing protein n=1 Tax=Triparma retinervis TaxID=2557542 RepID=A0A9W6ZXE1_9STRA|nr:hypothetical protein TrRE_jg1225 [Triparma retinervis]
MSKSRKNITCLYTKHKTQKRKVWQDGVMCVSRCGTVTLHCSSGTSKTPLDTVEVNAREMEGIMRGEGKEVEFRGYLAVGEGEEGEKKVEGGRKVNGIGEWGVFQG